MRGAAALLNHASLVIHEAAGQTSKERYFHAIQRFRIAKRTQRQIANEYHIAREEQPGDHLRPREDNMNQKYSTEEHGRLPGMETNVIALVLKQQQHYASSWR